MDEKFLTFIWQYQCFEHHNLRSTKHESIDILYVGKLNTHAGADFEQAHVRITGIEWQGDVELHLKSSDWQEHKHQQDQRYNRVVLHVVWQDDMPIVRPDGTIIPTLELQNIVDHSLLHRYQSFINHKEHIPCQGLLSEVDNLYISSMLDKALVERLEQKASQIRDLWIHTHKDWEELTYQLLAKNFGFKVNSEAFLRLAQLTPLKYILKHRDNLFQIEALLLGQAGFLGDTIDEYSQKLNKEYHFLKSKYQLTGLAKHEWKFLRLRPANFPTMRIAQFAQLLHKNVNLFSVLIFANNFKTIKKILDIEASPYWHTHYTLGKETTKTAYKLGKNSIENIIINNIVGLLVLYAQENKKIKFMEKAVVFLENLPLEKNHVISMWQEMGIRATNAADSQALIQQYNWACLPKKCLQCTVGVQILKKQAKS